MGNKDWGIKNWFKTDVERLGSSVPQLVTDEGSTKAHQEGARRVMDRLPRGGSVIRDVVDRKERARWAYPAEIAQYRYKIGDAVLGKSGCGLIGAGDDKPMVTVASARSGKTSTVLKPTLYAYRGSMVVLDPKGELARDTARHRREVLGQETYVLDHFGCSGEASAPFNPLSEFDVNSRTILDDVDILAETIILDEGGGDGSHWTNSARALLRGLILHTLQKPAHERTLVTVRQLLMLTYPPLARLQAELDAKKSEDSAEAVQTALFMEMARQGNVFGGAVAGAGNSFLRKSSRERSSIVSTAETQTKFLDSLPLQESLRGGSFKLASIAERPTTVYICMPSSHMVSQFRYLRLIVRLALLALEKRGAWPRGKLPILFMMEEFATLGHMPIMEQAAAYFPGFGVKLWAVLQDLGQLERHYKAAYQTFLGNAGVLQFFANGDEKTLKYISDRLGSLSFVRGKFGGSEDEKAREFVDKERLLYHHEASEAFARGTGAQLLLIEGQPPMAIERLSFADVEDIRLALVDDKADRDAKLKPA